jgi:putative peptidoglycan lipid II flippase
MSKSLERIGIVSVATVLSRLLGLVRDVLTFAVFGTSALNSAFLFAFTLPNLFRRLLGEGALTAALVPNLTEELEENGQAGAFLLLSKVFSWLFLITTVLVIVSIGFFLMVPFIPWLPGRWYVSANLAIYLFPYLIFVCLAAVLGAALNVLHRFAVAALSAVWLNLAIIFSLGGLGLWLAETQEGRMLFLCAGVLAGGALQLLVPWVAMIREGWRPKVDLRPSPRLRDVYLLMLPGLAGAAIFQINVVVSRSLAFGVNEAAVSVLYLANRLMEFPLGIFTIAVATVIFPVLARHAVRQDFASYAEAYRKGLLLIFLITLPATAGIFLLSRPIVGLLFEWGAFDDQDTALTVPVLGIFALTLPFYSVATFATRGFHSVKNTSTPVKIAGVSFVINLVLSLLLMRPLGMVGLALANLGSIVIQSVMLQASFARKRAGLRLPLLVPELAKIVLATGAMVGFLLVMGERIQQWMGTGKWGDAVALLLLIPMGMAVYFAAVWWMRVEGRHEAETLARRILGRPKRLDTPVS